MVHEYNRIFSLAAALIFGIVILGSSAFVAFHSEHLCTDDDCDICEMLKQCEKILNTLNGTVSTKIEDPVPFENNEAKDRFSENISFASTLVTLKVELLN